MEAPVAEGAEQAGRVCEHGAGGAVPRCGGWVRGPPAIASGCCTTIPAQPSFRTWHGTISKDVHSSYFFPTLQAANCLAGKVGRFIPH